jgi:hypothetical protein
MPIINVQIEEDKPIKTTQVGKNQKSDDSGDDEDAKVFFN